MYIYTYIKQVYQKDKFALQFNPYGCDEKRKTTVVYIKLLMIISIRDLIHYCKSETEREEYIYIYKYIYIYI